MNAKITKIQRLGKDRLSDKLVRDFIKDTAAGTAETTKLSDGGGIFLSITPAGTPAWRFRFRFAGREQLASLGTWPDVGREAARVERDTMKAWLKKGRHPITERRLERERASVATGTTFRAVADEWFAKQADNWKPAYLRRTRIWFEKNAMPDIGNLPIADIDVTMIERIIKSIERRKARVYARKLLQWITSIFRHAQAKKYCTDNPAALVPELLSKKRRVKHRPAITKWEALGDLLRRADAAKVSDSVQRAHRLIAFTAVRIGSVVPAEWSEFHLDDAVPKWIIPRAKCKITDRDFDFTVILSPTITSELKAWRAESRGTGYLFPSPTGNDIITVESVEKVYRKTLKLAGIHTPNSWRVSLSTLANDDGADWNMVEVSLDHEPRNKVARAYDRGEKLELRVKLMHWWDSQLTAAQHGTDVLPFRATGEG